MILNYREYLLESSVKSLHSDIEKKIKELGLGNLKDISIEDAFEFLDATIGKEGDFNKVKDHDLKESYAYDPLNEGFEVIEFLGEVGEIFGSAAALQYILDKIGNRFGSASANDLHNRLTSFLRWMEAASGVQAEIIKRGFAFIARTLGANGVKAEIVGKVGLTICLIILLVCSLMVFPAIGGGGLFACIFAGVASIAKVREIIKLIIEIVHEIKNPSESDVDEYPSFFTLLSTLFHKNHEANAIPTS